MKEYSLILVLVCILSLVGCTKHETVKSIDFPFEIADITSVDTYHYEGVPAAAEKKTVTEKNDIEELYNYFENLTFQNKKAEETAGGSGTFFRFHLADNTQYEISYLSNGKNGGILKLLLDDVEHYTTADVGEYWLSLSYDAVSVESPDWQ